MGVDHLGANAGLRQGLRKQRRESNRAAKATLQNSSIGRAGIRVYDGGWIRIEDGGLSVTGTQTVTGTLTGSGTFNWTGPMNLQGAQSITGPTTFTGQMTVNGPWKLVGAGQITGNVNVTGDIEILAGGRVKVGNIIIDPSTAGGQIDLGSGRTIDAGSGFLAIRDGARFVVFNSTGVSINGGSGSPTVTVSVNGVRMSGLPKVTKAGIPSGCVYVASDGYLKEG